MTSIGGALRPLVSGSRPSPRPGRLASRALLAVVLVAFLLYLPTALGPERSLLGLDLSNTATLGIGLANVNFALIGVMGAVSLNLLVGYAGLLSLGHAAFLAIGALTGGLLGVEWGLPFWLVALSAGFVGAAIGAVAGLPSIRVGGIYLLLSTFALNAIVLYVFLKYERGTFGAAGIIYPVPTLAGYAIDTDREWFYLLAVCAAAVLLLVWNVLRTREGRSFVAIRDHDVAAASCGINVGLAKLKVFALSSFIVSLAGVLYAYYLTNATTETYTLELVIAYYAMIIVGGMASLLGSVLGALLWGFLPAILLTLSQEVDPSTPVVGGLLNEHRGSVNVIIFGVLIMVILIFRPDGLAGMWKSARASLRRWPYSS